jgi:hypothetical protein
MRTNVPRWVVTVLKATLGAALALAALLLPVRQARAQGCILIRQNAPVFGAEDQIVFTPGEWSLSFNYRQSYADDHYNGTQYQYQRKEIGNNVINTQQLYDLGATYAFSQRFSIFGSVPVVNASWSIPEPAQPPLGGRREQNASGIGDVSALARWWVLNPARHSRGNVSAAIGFKAPTGKYDVKDDYPNLNGTNNTPKTVDQSIQPGDGGWGVVFDFQGYKRLKPVTFYGSGSYLANPRDTNGAPSIIVGLGFAGNPAFADLLENSVPDQYVARAGAAFPLVRESLTLNLGFRIEGVPRYDLFGESHGWRRPGYETYVEPGFLFTHGRSTWSLYIPKGLVRNRRPNPYTGNSGDATFPDYLVLVGYSYKFGGGAPSASPRPGIPEPSQPSLPGDSTPPQPQVPHADSSGQAEAR